jgi:Transmembrane protein 43
MARKRAGTQRSYSPLLGLLVIAGLGAGAWYVWRHHHRVDKPALEHSEPASATGDVAAMRIDPANDGRRVRVTGDVRVDKVAQDPQLGVRSDSAVLWRKVEMLQWSEHCAQARCDYTLDWSADPIDSSAFRDKPGHVNPSGFPFRSQTFLGEHVRLGAFSIDSPAVADAAASVSYPVRAEQLPENLAATFRARQGILYAAANAEHPEAGDVRVAYRVLPSGQKQTWSGIQSGDRLKPSNN